MNSQFDAVMIAEGAQPVETEEQYMAAWQYLVDSGLVWQLQGFFGRTAHDLIQSGQIEPADPSRVHVWLTGDAA